MKLRAGNNYFFSNGIGLKPWFIHFSMFNLILNSFSNLFYYTCFVMLYTYCTWIFEFVLKRIQVLINLHFNCFLPLMFKMRTSFLLFFFSCFQMKILYTNIHRFCISCIIYMLFCVLFVLYLYFFPCVIRN